MGENRLATDLVGQLILGCPVKCVCNPVVVQPVAVDPLVEPVAEPDSASDSADPDADSDSAQADGRRGKDSEGKENRKKEQK